jgi:hypothetical protein
MQEPAPVATRLAVHEIGSRHIQYDSATFSKRGSFAFIDPSTFCLN